RVLCGKRYKADETRILLDNALALPKLQSQLVTGGATALPRVIVAAPRADRSYPLRLQPERNELRVRMRQGGAGTCTPVAKQHDARDVRPVKQRAHAIPIGRGNNARRIRRQ